MTEEGIKVVVDAVVVVNVGVAVDVDIIVEVDLGVTVDVAMTVIVYWPEIPPPVTVIVAVPGPAPVTRPVEVTVATPASLELHV